MGAFQVNKFDYVRATSVDEAIKILEEKGNSAKILAGGTDVLVQCHSGEIKPELLVDIKGLNLNDINSLENGGLRIGASSTLTSIMESDIIRSKYKILVETADDMASVQVRNRATIGGNLCNASPSADMAPPLIALDAQVVIKNSNGKRKIDLENFFLGPGKIDILPGEILTEIHLPPIPNRSGAVYLKQKRNAMDLALVGVAVQLILNEDETCASVKIVLGAVGPTPIVARKASSILSQARPNKHSIEKAAAMAAEEAKPIDDIRTSAWHRSCIVKVLAARAIDIAYKRAIQSSINNGGGL